MILPKDRDPRFITIRRGGTLTDSDHKLLALWAAACAEHVLHLFEPARPADTRPRQAIEQARAWVRGEVKMSEARASAGHANAAARDLAGPLGRPHTLPVRRRRLRMSRHTSSVRRPTPSRPRVRLLPRVRGRTPAGSSTWRSARNAAIGTASRSWKVEALTLRTSPAFTSPFIPRFHVTCTVMRGSVRT